MWISPALSSSLDAVCGLGAVPFQPLNFFSMASLIAWATSLVVMPRITPPATIEWTLIAWAPGLVTVPGAFPSRHWILAVLSVPPPGSPQSACIAEPAVEFKNTRSG